MRGVEVLHGGFATTVQDAGRCGYQQYGLPTAGAMDEFAQRVGNILTGNSQNAASLEITMLGPQLRFHGETVAAITGAMISPRLNGQVLPMWESFSAGDGDVLSFGPNLGGCRAYLSIAGGLGLAPVMGSLSTYVRAAIGGLNGRKLQAGDFIPLLPLPMEAAALTGLRCDSNFIPHYPADSTLRVIMGPQDDYFTVRSRETFLSSEFTITPESDRMGYRLEGVPLEHSKGADIISDGIPLGAVQVPGHGHPIVMLADRPTTGGYAKIATVISVDIPIIAQLKPGEKVRFCRVSVDEAQQAQKVFEEKILLFEENIRAVTGSYTIYEISAAEKYFRVHVRKIQAGGPDRQHEPTKAGGQ